MNERKERVTPGENRKQGATDQHVMQVGYHIGLRFALEVVCYRELLVRPASVARWFEIRDESMNAFRARLRSLCAANDQSASEMTSPPQ